METTFKKQHGKVYSPETFAVIYFKNGETKRVPNVDDLTGILDYYNNSRKAELYKNGTVNLSATLLDTYQE